MGWLWGSDAGSTNTNDPFQNLDPTLKEFFIRESPIRSAHLHDEKKSPDIASSNTEHTKEPPNPQEVRESSAKPAVPAQSLYPDGRYAHLWKNYRPLSDIESEQKTDQEKMLDILHGYKKRKALIGRAAVENCALEQIAQADCQKHGGFPSKLSMCRSESKTFERCYTTQSRFLKALGYLNDVNRPPSVDEEIQMHADKLYHKMLAEEKASQVTNLDSASAANSAKPHRPQSQPKLSEQAMKTLKPEVIEDLLEKTKDMTSAEREVEERDALAEYETACRISAQMDDIKALRKERWQPVGDGHDGQDKAQSDGLWQSLLKKTQQR